LLVSSNQVKFEKEGNYGLLIKPTSQATEGVTHTFGLVLYTQSSETIFSPGIWNKFQGRYVDKLFKTTVQDISESLMLVIESTSDVSDIRLKLTKKHRNELNEDVWLQIPSRRKSGFFFSKSQIEQFCDVKQTGGFHGAYTSKDCNLFVKVSTAPEEISQMSILLVVGNSPITVEDGMGFSLPVPLNRPVKLSLASLPPQIMTVAFSSPTYDIQVKAILHSAGLDSLDEQSYVATGSTSVSIHIPVEHIKKHAKPWLEVIASNIDAMILKEFENRQHSEEFDFLNFMDVVISSGISELRPGISMQQKVQKGFCTHFTLKKLASSHGLVSIVRMIAGDVLMYLKKGSGTLASSHSFDQLSSSYQTGTLSLEASQAPATHNGFEEFSLAICAETNANLELAYFVNMLYPLYNINSGQVIRRLLKQDDHILIHFVAKDLKSFTINFDGESSRMLIYKKEFEGSLPTKSFDELIPPKSVEFLVGVNNSPGLPSSSRVEVGNRSLVHYVFLVKTLEDDRITFFIDDMRDTVLIELKENDKLNDMMVAGSVRNFAFSSEEFGSWMSASISLKYGSIKILTSNKPITNMNDLTHANAYTMEAKGSNAHEKRLEVIGGERNQDLIFKRSFISIKAITNTLYDIEWSNPDHRYKRLVPGKRERIRVAADRQSSVLFYPIEKNSGITSLKLIIRSDIIDEADEDGSRMADLILQNIKFSFLIDEGFGIFDSNLKVQKVVADYKNKKVVRLRASFTMTLDFNLMTGYFAVEPVASLAHLLPASASVELSLNSFISMNPNTYVFDSVVDSEVDRYEMIIPSAGKLWLDIEDCSGELHAVSSRSLQEVESAVSKPTFPTTIESFDEPAVYYILLKKKTGSKLEKISFIIRSEFMDASKPAFISSYFKNEDGSYTLSPQQVQVSEDADTVTALVQHRIPPSSVSQDYPEVTSIEVNVVIAVTPAAASTQLSKCKPIDLVKIHTQNTSVKSIGFRNYQADRNKSIANQFDFSKIASPWNMTVRYPESQSNDFNVLVYFVYYLQGQSQEESNDDFLFQLAHSQQISRPAKQSPQTGEATKKEPTTPQANNNSSTYWLFFVLFSMLLIGVIYYFIRRAMLRNINKPDSHQKSTSTATPPGPDFSSPQSTSDGSTQLEITANVSDSI